MTEAELEKLRFPIGKFEKPVKVEMFHIRKWIEDIENLPQWLRTETAHLRDEQLDTVYRPGGWTLRQVTHHCADSHINAFIRFRLALTEDHPTIKPYREDLWANFGDNLRMPVEPTLRLLEGLHARWVMVLRSMSAADMQRTFMHPEHGRVFTLEETIGTYAWHGNHHLAHITTLKQNKGWK